MAFYEFDEENYPSLYDEGESPSELLDSINQKSTSKMI